MTDRVFVDTNVLIYLYSTTEPDKKRIAQEIFVKYKCIISTQVLNEFCNVCIKKWKYDCADIEKALDEILDNCFLVGVGQGTIRKALKIQKGLGYQYFDCLMIASGIENHCAYLLTEDMSDNKVIGDMKIVNVFGSREC